MPARNETVYEPVPSLRFDTTPPTPFDFVQGRVYWDEQDQTLAVQQVGGDNPVTQQIGQEQQVLVWNNSGVDYPNGAIVYPSGSLAWRPTATLGKADSILTARARGITTQPIPKNTMGFVCTFGLVRDFDTQTPGWAEGDFLYLSPTVAGGLQNTAPTIATGGYNVPCAYVLRRHPTDGMLFFKPYDYPAFGDVPGGHYTDFEYDGTFVLHGNATTWRDELGALIGQRLESPSSDIVENLAEGSLTFKATARYPTDFVVYTLQLNHDWFNSLVEFHCHW